jgi:hypothetical protein
MLGDPHLMTRGDDPGGDYPGGDDEFSPTAVSAPCFRTEVVSGPRKRPCEAFTQADRRTDAFARGLAQPRHDAPETAPIPGSLVPYGPAIAEPAVPEAAQAQDAYR